MPYTARDLSVLAYANGFTLWHYRSPDPLPRLMSDDYFAPGREMFRLGDFLMVNAGGQGATLMVARRDSNGVGMVTLASSGLTSPAVSDNPDDAASPWLPA